MSGRGLPLARQFTKHIPTREERGELNLPLLRADIARGWEFFTATRPWLRELEKIWRLDFGPKGGKSA